METSSYFVNFEKSKMRFSDVWATTTKGSHEWRSLHSQIINLDSLWKLYIHACFWPPTLHIWAVVLSHSLASLTESLLLNTIERIESNSVYTIVASAFTRLSLYCVVDRWTVSQRINRCTTTCSRHEVEVRRDDNDDDVVLWYLVLANKQSWYNL